jgi:phytoene/squalene synthetase
MLLRMDIDDTSPLPPTSADDCTAYAEEAIERAEHATDAQDRLEHLSRAQAWAMLAVAASVAALGASLAARRADQ